MSDGLSAYRRKVRQTKNLLIQEMYGNDEGALHYSVHYLDLRKMLLEAVNYIKFVGAQEPAALIVSSLPRFDPQLNEAVLKAILCVASLLEVLNMLQKQYDSQLCKLMLRISSIDSDRSSMGRILEIGLLEMSAAAVRDSLMNISSHRNKIMHSNKAELLFALRCVLHTVRVHSSLLSVLEDEYSLSDFFEGMAKLHLVEPLLLAEMVTVIQDPHWTCSPALANALFESAMLKNNIAAIEKFDGTFLMQLILSCHRQHKRDVQQEASALTQSLILCTRLSMLIYLNLWQVRKLPLAQLKLFVVCLMDIVKFVYLSNSVPGAETLLSKHNGKFVESALQTCCFLFSRRIDLLYSFLIKYVPLALLGCDMSSDTTFSTTLFAMLETVPAFTNYMAATWTPEMGQKLSRLMSPEGYEIVKARATVYERAVQADVDARYTDNLTGCFIITPGIVLSHGVKMWVDAYDFEACLFMKEENPYTREPLTAEEFQLLQQDLSHEIAAYDADRKGLIRLCKIDRGASAVGTGPTHP